MISKSSQSNHLRINQMKEKTHRKQQKKFSALKQQSTERIQHVRDHEYRKSSNCIQTKHIITQKKIKQCTDSFQTQQNFSQPCLQFDMPKFYASQDEYKMQSIPLCNSILISADQQNQKIVQKIINQTINVEQKISELTKKTVQNLFKSQSQIKKQQSLLQSEQIFASSYKMLQQISQIEFYDMIRPQPLQAPLKAVSKKQQYHKKIQKIMSMKLHSAAYSPNQFMLAAIQEKASENTTNHILSSIAVETQIRAGIDANLKRISRKYDNDKQKISIFCESYKDSQQKIVQKQQNNIKNIKESMQFQMDYLTKRVERLTAQINACKKSKKTVQDSCLSQKQQKESSCCPSPLRKIIKSIRKQQKSSQKQNDKKRANKLIKILQKKTLLH